MPLGPSTAAIKSFSGRCSNALAQSTGGICGAKSNIFEALIKSACEVFGGNMGRTWFCSPYSQSIKSICTAPPRYQLPCSLYGPTLPTPAPKLSGMIVVSALLPSEAAASCHSAVEEQPISPTFPFDHGCDDIQLNWSSASESGAPRMS